MRVAEPVLRRRAGVPWLLLGNVAYSVSLWLVVVIASRADTVILGQYALAMAIVSPLHLLFRGNLRELFATDGRGEFAWPEYRRLRLLAAGTFVVVCLAAALAAPYPAPVRWSIAVLAVAKTVDMGSDLAYGVFQQRHDLRSVASSLLLRGGLAVAFAGLGVVVLGSAIGLALGLALGWGSVLLLHDRPHARRDATAAAQRSGDSGRRAARVPWRLLHAAWPLGVVAMLLSLMHNLPRYVVEQQQGFAAVGVYAGISYLVVAAAGVGAAVGQGQAATFGVLWAEGRRRAVLRQMWRSSAVLAAGALCAALVAIPFGGRVLALLYGEAFRPYGAELVAVCLAAIPVAALPITSAALTASRRRTAQAACLALGAAVTALSGPALISRWSLSGAVLSLALGFGTSWVSQIAVLRAAAADRGGVSVEATP